MGYEIKLLIGEPCLKNPEYKHGEIKCYDDGSRGRELMCDKENKPILTGRDEYWFRVWITIDLCMPGYGSAIVSISNAMPKDKNEVMYWFEDDIRTTEDRYGTELRPVPIREVLEAIKKDAEREDYRRFHWALALLNSMKNEDNAHVLLFGH